MPGWPGWGAGPLPGPAGAGRRRWRPLARPGLLIAPARAPGCCCCLQDLKDKFRECGTVVYANVTRGDDGASSRPAAGTPSTASQS